MSSSRIARYAVLGYPIAHSLSPLMQRAAFQTLGIRATYEAIEAGPDDAATLFARLREARYAGWNVTTPLKEQALALVDQASDEARAASSVNAVRLNADGTLEGHNTDGKGLVQALHELWSFEAAGHSVLVLGSGPAARAAIVALKEHGALVACWARDGERAARLAPPLSRPPALIVSALAAEASLPGYVVAAADDATMIFDCNYGRRHSPIAAMRGNRRSDGLPLLLHQGALAFAWWTGKPAPLEAMRDALRSQTSERTQSII
jgi:shikimate dehydrogenase